MTFLKKYFDTPEKTIGSLGLIFSFAPIIVSIKPFLFPEEVPGQLIIYNVSVVLALGCIIAYTAIRLGKRGRIVETQARQIATHLQNSHHVAHHCRDAIYKHYLLTVSKVDLHSPFTSDDFSLLKRLCRRITKGLRTAYISYFSSKGININNDICITIRIIVPKTTPALSKTADARLSDEEREILSKSELVKTLYVDSDAWFNFPNRRPASTKLYVIDNNTMLSHVLKIPRENYYCNNLRSLGNKYSDQTDNWNQWYNAIHVVPIRCIDASGASLYFGVLTVDSRNEDGHELFNLEECVHISGQAADFLCIVFLSLLRLQVSAV